jgi:hypothetical protein
VTTAFVEGQLASWTEGEQVILCDLAPALQELIDQETWAPGNEMSIVLRDDGSGAGNRIALTDFDDDPTKTVTIEVAFTVA